MTHASLVVCKLNAASEILSMAIYCGNNIHFILERFCYTVVIAVLYLNIAMQSRTAQCQH